MLTVSNAWAIGIAAVAVVAMTAFGWRRVFSPEARDRRRRMRNYGKISSTRQHRPAVQLNLNVPTEERDRKR